MAINWGLSAQPFNALEALQAAGHAQQQKLQQVQLERQQRMQDVQLRQREQQIQREETTRAGLMSAYNPQTGAIDPVAARQAYLSGGDVQGAISFDASQAKSRTDAIEASLKAAQATTGLLATATDPVSYAAARARAQAIGLDITGVPEAYDPAWVQNATMQSLDAKDRLSAQLAREKLAIDTENARRDDARQDRVANNSIATSNARLGLAQRVDRRSAESRNEGRVRFRERDKDRAALAGRGAGIRTDLEDLNY